MPDGEDPDRPLRACFDALDTLEPRERGFVIQHLLEECRALFGSRRVQGPTARPGVKIRFEEGPPRLVLSWEFAVLADSHPSVRQGLGAARGALRALGHPVEADAQRVLLDLHVAPADPNFRVCVGPHRIDYALLRGARFSRAEKDLIRPLFTRLGRLASSVRNQQVPIQRIAVECLDRLLDDYA